eukprot:5439274-Lingulodinium_polyedra.AAC.1
MMGLMSRPGCRSTQSWRRSAWVLRQHRAAVPPKQVAPFVWASSERSSSHGKGGDPGEMTEAHPNFFSLECSCTFSLAGMCISASSAAL